MNIKQKQRKVLRNISKWEKTMKRYYSFHFMKIKAGYAFQSNMVKLGDGPHYKTESKEGHKQDNYRWIHKNQNKAIKQSTHKQLTQVRSLDNETTKPTLTHTDSWLKSHFGSSGMSSSARDLRSMGSYEGNATKKASSICEVRHVDGGEKVYIAKVRLEM